MGWEDLLVNGFPCLETGKSAEGISYIGNLDILTALIIAAQLKDQCPYMVAQLSL